MNSTIINDIGGSHDKEPRIEGHQMAQALVASELRYRRLFESAQDGILILDAETGMVVDVNPFMISLLGYSHDQFLGKAIWELGVFKDLVANEGKFCELREKEYVRYESLPLETSDRRRIEVEFVSNVYLVNDSKVIQCNIRDIPERKRAQAQLKLLETCIGRLNDIVVITEAVPQTEPGPRILFVNDAFVRRTGYSLVEVIGRSPRFLQGPKTGRDELDRINEAMRQWKPVRAELLNYTKSGEEFWLELDIVPVADASGGFTHWVSVGRDITERKRTEEALRTSEEKYQGLFVVTRDAILTIEPPLWRFTSGNAAAVKMFGAHDVDELVSYAPWEASPERQPDGRLSVEKAREMIGNAIREGSHFFEWTHRRFCGGGEFPVDVLLTRVGLGENATIHATVRDITERKRYESRFRRLVDSNAQAIMFWNTKGEITGANDAFLRLVAYTRGDLEAGRITWAVLTPPEDNDRDRRAFEEIAAHGVCMPYEREYLSKNGSRVAVLAGAATFDDNPEEASASLSI